MVLFGCIAIGVSVFKMTTAQTIFDRIQSGDEALRAKVNRAAAEACGWTNINRWVIDEKYDCGNAPNGESVNPIPDYLSDLTDAAGLPLPRLHIMSVNHYEGRECHVRCDLSILSVRNPDKMIKFTDHTPATEALARTVCWYVATGGAE